MSVLLDYRCTPKAVGAITDGVLQRSLLKAMAFVCLEGFFLKVLRGVGMEREAVDELLYRVGKRLEARWAERRPGVRESPRHRGEDVKGAACPPDTDAYTKR